MRDESIYTEDEEPDWMRHTTSLWTEDDACRAAGDDSREQLSDAWQRLFGEPLPEREAIVASADLGDCFARLYPHGRIAIHGYWGDTISVVSDAPSSDDEEPDVPAPAPSTQSSKTSGIRLSDDQVQAIEDVLGAFDAGEKVIVLKGPAGTGKTTIANELSAEFADRGYAVQYLAPTGKAAARISEVVGQAAHTIHSKLFRAVSIDRQGRPHFSEPQQMGSGRVVFICDEGSMVGKRLHDKLVEYLHDDARLLYLMDDKQVLPVADTPFFTSFEGTTAELFTVHRQGKGDPILDIVTALRGGTPIPKTSIEGKDGKFYRRQSASRRDAATWMTEHLEQNNDAVVLCYSNKTRRAINRLVRASLGHRGTNIQVGESILIRQNNKFLGKQNGQICTVKSIENYRGLANTFVLHTDEGPLLTATDLIGEDKIEFSKRKKLLGDKIDGRLWVPVDYAYALTVHTSQGSEYDHVCFVIDGTFRWMLQTKKMSYADASRLCYTALTRAKRTVLVLDTK